MACTTCACSSRTRRPHDRAPRWSQRAQSTTPFRPSRSPASPCISNVRGTRGAHCAPRRRPARACSRSRSSGVRPARRRSARPRTRERRTTANWNTAGAQDGIYRSTHSPPTSPATRPRHRGRTSRSTTRLRTPRRRPRRLSRPSRPRRRSRSSPSTDPSVSACLAAVEHYDVYRTGTQVNADADHGNGRPRYDWSDVAGPVRLHDAPADDPEHLLLHRARRRPGGQHSRPRRRRCRSSLDPTARLRADRSVAALAIADEPAPAGLAGPRPRAPASRSPLQRLPRHGVRAPVGVINVPATTFTDSGPHERDLLLPGGRREQRRRAASWASRPAAVTVVYDTTAPVRAGRRHGHGRARRLGRHQLGRRERRRRLGHRALRRAPVAVLERRRRRSPTATPRARALSTSCADATALNGKLYSYAVFAVDAVGNTSAGRQLAPPSRRATRSRPRRPRASRPRRATPASICAGAAAAADDDVAGYVLVAKQGTQAPASETDGTRVCTTIVAGVDRVLGGRPDERRHVHVRALRARRGAQPLAGRRRQRRAERQGDRRRGAGGRRRGSRPRSSGTRSR